jgi:hypothetical protein
MRKRTVYIALYADGCMDVDVAIYCEDEQKVDRFMSESKRPMVKYTMNVVCHKGLCSILSEELDAYNDAFFAQYWRKSTV